MIARCAPYRDADKPLPLPDNPLPHLVQRLMEIGPVRSTGMDRAPIDWGEIENWKRGTGLVLSTWETRLLRRLSVEYLNEAREAEDEYCPAPWVPLSGGR